MKKVITYLLIILSTACSDKPEENNCDPENFEADPVGQWFLGDFHVHATGASNDTGGDSWPADIKRVAMERGLDFVVLTDHSNSTGSDTSTTEEDSTLFNQGPEFPYWQTADSLSEAGVFLMVNGNEISPEYSDKSQPTGHIGCIPQNLATFDPNIAFTDRPKGAVNGGNALLQARDAGCFSIVNHPYAPTPWIAFDWIGDDYDAFEIWNGTIGYDGGDEKGYNIWRCDLLQGKKVSAVGGSDNHRVNIDAPGSGLDPALGYPTTAVFASEFSWEAIMIGLQNGETTVFEGNSRLFIDGYSEDGCRAEGNEIRWIRLRGSVDVLNENPELKLFRATACTDNRPDFKKGPVIEELILWDEILTTDESFDIKVEIQGESGVYTATISQHLGHYGAFSKAIVIP